MSKDAQYSAIKRLIDEYIYIEDSAKYSEFIRKLADILNV